MECIEWWNRHGGTCKYSWWDNSKIKTRCITTRARLDLWPTQKCLHLDSMASPQLQTRHPIFQLSPSNSRLEGQVWQVTLRPLRLEIKENIRSTLKLGSRQAWLFVTLEPRQVLCVVPPPLGSELFGVAPISSNSSTLRTSTYNRSFK